MNLYYCQPILGLFFQWVQCDIYFSHVYEGNLAQDFGVDEHRVAKYVFIPEF